MIDERHTRVIARVRVELPDGSEETCLIPTRLATNGPYYHEWIYPPAGARVIERTHELRPLDSGQEIKIDRRELFSEPS